MDTNFLGQRQFKILRFIETKPAIGLTEKRGKKRRSIMWQAGCHQRVAIHAAERLMELGLMVELEDELGRRIFQITTEGKRVLHTVNRFSLSKKNRVSIDDIELFKKIGRFGKAPIRNSFLSKTGKKLIDLYGDRIEIVAIDKTGKWNEILSTSLVTEQK